MGTRQKNQKPVTTESFRQKVEREYKKSMKEMREYFALCDAAREARFNAGDTGVYEEL